METTKRAIPLPILKDITSAVMHAATASTLEQVLQRIADAARDLLKARYAALGVPDGQGGLTHFIVSGISPADASKIDHLPVGRGLIGALMKDRESMRMAHMKDDDRAVGFPENHPPMDRFLGVPIQVGEDLFGLLYLTDREDGEPFSLGDQWLAETLAGYAALAIAGVQLRDQNQRLTLLEERQRIGMALHDGIIQSLYALGMHLDLIRNTVQAPAERFQPVIDGLNGVIEEIRDYVMNLRRQRAPGTHACYSALEDVITTLYIPSSLQVIINAPKTDLPFDDHEVASICMIVREALSNVVRHASASTVTLSAWHKPDHLKVTIHDDGVGFDVSDLNRDNGLGVRNMHERARIHEGKLTIKSSDENGTTVSLVVPIKDPAATRSA
jgi:signal transduction histidine kinase